jgi:tetratricopeptide (TPR) repeat protein
MKRIATDALSHTETNFKRHKAYLRDHLVQIEHQQEQLEKNRNNNNNNDISPHTHLYTTHLLLLLQCPEDELDINQLLLMNTWDYILDQSIYSTVKKELFKLSEMESDISKRLMYKYGIYRTYDEFSTQLFEEMNASINEAYAIRNNRLCSLLYNLRGFMYNSIGMYEKALEDLNKSLYYHPNYLIAMTNRAYTYRQLQMIPNALSEYNKLLEQVPIYAEYYIDRADILADIGRYEEAIADYTTAISLNSQNPLLYYNRCITFEQMGFHVKSFSDIRIAMELDQTEQDFLVKYEELLQVLMHSSKERLL